MRPDLACSESSLWSTRTAGWRSGGVGWGGAKDGRSARLRVSVASWSRVRGAGKGKRPDGTLSRSQPIVKSGLNAYADNVLGRSLAIGFLATERMNDREPRVCA